MFSSGRRIVTPKIVQQDTGNRKWWIAFFLVLIAIWSWYVFDFGRQRAGLDVDIFKSEIRELEDTIKIQHKKIESLRVESASFQRAAQIDKNAASQAQENMKLFQQEKAELKRELDFLNRLLSDKNKKALIRLKHLNITQAADNNSYILQFTLVHLTKVGGTVKGKALVDVSGVQDGKAVKKVLSEIATDKKQSLKMGFKNFQKFQTTLQLPEGFVPDSVTVSAKLDSKGIEDFEEVRPWQVAEN